MSGIYQPMPGMFYLKVADADAVYNRALESGAESISAPADQPYGDRTGSVKDASGNTHPPHHPEDRQLRHRTLRRVWHLSADAGHVLSQGGGRGCRLSPCPDRKSVV